MPLVRTSGSLAIRCFKSLEHFADRLTGAAGPVFVTICWVLIVLGGISFVDVILIHKPLTITRLLYTPIAGLILSNLYGQYYYATTVPAGNPEVVVEEVKREAPWMITKAKGAINASDEQVVFADGTWGGDRLRKCGNCSGPKPLRTHHCKVCRSCVLMMDHHCPWINQCVGLYNQRYFVSFMIWLSIACWTFATLGYQDFWISIAYKPVWPATTPSILFTLIYILAVAIGIAVPMLLGWHLYLIVRGETSIEGHDNDYFMKKAKERGMIYINPYDLGKRGNLEFFFNVGPGRLPYYTAVLPFRYPPAVTGWRFPLHPVALSRKREALYGGSPDSRSNIVIGDEDEGELTDDEGGGGGFWDDERAEDVWR